MFVEGRLKCDPLFTFIKKHSGDGAIVGNLVLSLLLHLDRELALHLVKQHLRLIIHHQYQALLLREMTLVRKPSVPTL